MRFRIRFDLVEDTDKQEKDFGISNEKRKEFRANREVLINKHIESLKEFIRDNYTFQDYQWVENLKIEEIEEEINR